MGRERVCGILKSLFALRRRRRVSRGVDVDVFGMSVSWASEDVSRGFGNEVGGSWLVGMRVRVGARCVMVEAVTLREPSSSLIWLHEKRIVQS